MGPPPEGRDWRGRKRWRLQCECCQSKSLTRIELIDLLVRITNALPDMPEGSASRQIALINLRNIRSVLARHDLTP